MIPFPRPFRTLLGLALTLPPAMAGAQGSLQARFIGNAAFELSDGRATILVDFPYQSGAFGYMTFPATELDRRPGALCLVTHHHDDHFAAAAVARIGCSVAGPGEVQRAVPQSSRAGPGPVWQFEGVRIQCVSTPHGPIEHCSYLINWQGLSIFFSGDIGNLDPIRQLSDPPDVVFLPSWLLASREELGALVPGARIIVYHHQANEQLPPCGRCFVPGQGRSVTLTPP